MKIVESLCKDSNYISIIHQKQISLKLKFLYLTRITFGCSFSVETGWTLFTSISSRVGKLTLGIFKRQDVNLDDDSQLSVSSSSLQSTTLSWSASSVSSEINKIDLELSHSAIKNINQFYLFKGKKFDIIFSLSSWKLKG